MTLQDASLGWPCIPGKMGGSLKFIPSEGQRNGIPRSPPRFPVIEPHDFTGARSLACEPRIKMCHVEPNEIVRREFIPASWIYPPCPQPSRPPKGNASRSVLIFFSFTMHHLTLAESGHAGNNWTRCKTREKKHTALFNPLQSSFSLEIFNNSRRNRNSIFAKLARK